MGGQQLTQQQQLALAGQLFQVGRALGHMDYQNSKHFMRI